MLGHFPLFINGEFKASRNKKDIYNPATGEAIASVSMADRRDVLSAIKAAREAYDQGPWPRMSLDKRKEIILNISKGILEKAKELAEIETLNNGKPIKEATFMDIPSSAETFDYFANNLENYLKEEVIGIDSQIAKAESKLSPEPRGVVVLIVPWNYPLLISSWKLAQSLAAGNTVILKPSSLTPLSVLELAKIIKDSGIPNGVVNIISGSGDEVGKALCSDQRVDMISFTGSNSVGKKIIEYSAENVKKLIMELGGKSASIVLADADLELAVNGSLCSIFLNQGQMCTAMSRIFVESSIYDEFISNFINKVKRIKIGPGIDFQTQIGPLISKEQRNKVISYIQKAKDQGAKMLWGGNIPKDSDLEKGFFFEPTVLTDVAAEASIFQEEVFGPVVIINKFSSKEQAVELANNSDFGLAACIWTKDKSKAKELACKVNAGTVWINTYGMFFSKLPYGGFKQSGFGKELGREGFLEYTRLKNVISDNTQDSKPLVNYWYGF